MQKRMPADRRVVSPSFSELVGRETGGGERGVIDPLAGMDYAAELAARNRALTQFWARHGLSGKPEAIQPSPRPRRYRTTTRRRVFAGEHGVRFGFDETGETLARRVAASVLEPVEHDQIYRFIHEKISAPPYRHLARRLNHVIIRGSYTEFCVIFNVDRLDADIVRKIRTVSEHLQAAESRVTAAFIYQDPLRSRYYFEQFAPDTPVRIKQVFGREMLMTGVSGRRYLHAPTAFSQANESILPALCEAVEGLLGADGGGRLIDLYCGYGLFSHYLADRFDEILGADVNAAAIESAHRNVRLNPGRARRVFLTREITGHSLPGLWSGRRPARESVILDPPRQGTAPGVIDAITAWQPARVVHIFCEVDEIPGAVVEWAHGGYRLDRIVPLDLFPGTPNLEVALAFSHG